ncbi:hypothetical protein Tco_1412951 [Tanacetum coccineum]
MVPLGASAVNLVEGERPADITLAALGEMFEGTYNIMNWIGDCAKREKENYILLLSRILCSLSLSLEPPPRPPLSTADHHHRRPALPPTIGRRLSPAAAVPLPPPFSFFVRGFQDLKV